jgi:hypothetical protein
VKIHHADDTADQAVMTAAYASVLHQDQKLETIYGCLYLPASFFRLCASPVHMGATCTKPPPCTALLDPRLLLMRSTSLLRTCRQIFRNAKLSMTCLLFWKVQVAMELAHSSL